MGHGSEVIVGSLHSKSSMVSVKQLGLHYSDCYEKVNN